MEGERGGEREGGEEGERGGGRGEEEGGRGGGEGEEGVCGETDVSGEGMLVVVE